MKQKHEYKHGQDHEQMNHSGSHTDHHETSVIEELNTGWEVHPQQIQPHQDVEITITIKDKHGIAAEAFSFVHEKQMHLLAISKDLSSFQHLHPEYKGNGEFRVKVQFSKAGNYKLYADFMPEGGAQQLATFEIKVEGKAATKQIVPDQELKKRLNDLDFQLTFDPLAANQHLKMAFTITDSDSKEPVTGLEPYLGSAGHVVIVSEDMEKFLHVHPVDENTSGPTVVYMTSFPEEGIYKIWGQFKHKGKLYTAPFVIEVPRG